LSCGLGTPAINRGWLAEPKLPKAAKAGGARRDRTDDLLLAKQALSQLSYGPVQGSEIRCQKSGTAHCFVLTSDT